MAYIYKITNLINGKIYVGKRVRENPSDVKNYFGSGIAIRGAIEKYGKENFSKEILEHVDVTKNCKLLCDREKYWISKLNSNDETVGYNLTPGGDGACTHEAGMKGAITRKLRGYTHHSDETKKKISDSKKGVKFTEEHKKALSKSFWSEKRIESLKKRKCRKDGIKQSLSNDVRAKMRENHHLKCIHVVLLDNDSYYTTLDSIATIACKYNLTAIKLRRCSEVYDFRNGIVLLDLVDCEKAFNHRYANISSKDLVFINPITNEPCSPTSWRIYREHHMAECKEFPAHPYNDEYKLKKIDFCKEIEDKLTKILEEVYNEV
jgi:group I intron endonuclease